MGKTGIPWVPWDSHGNGNGMGMGIRQMGMGIKTWEREKKSLHTVNIASCAIHGIWAANGSQSCERCIQYCCSPCPVCQHLQQPAREYLALTATTGRLLEKRRTLTCCRELWTVSCSCIATKTCYNSTVWVKKNPPCGFLKFFPKRLGIFNQFFTHLLHDHFYTRVQIFIQISPTLTKLCHTKRDHLAKFYVSLDL